MRHVYALLLTLAAAVGSTAQARTLERFGEYLNAEISRVESGLAGEEAAVSDTEAAPPVETMDGWNLKSFRLMLQALFGWKLPGFVTLTVYPQIELYFDRVPKP